MQELYAAAYRVLRVYGADLAGTYNKDLLADDVRDYSGIAR